MDYDVLVVGGGIGGLTVAALLAARGVSVCLFERENRAGGCAANFSAGGYEFEGGAGLYSSWGPGELHERVFAELNASPPAVRPCTPPFVVRLADGTNIALSTDTEELEANLAKAFPECADAALAFYRHVLLTDSEIRSAAVRWPDLQSVPTSKNLRMLVDKQARKLVRLNRDTVAQHLGGMSPRFHQFIDAQLQMLAQATSVDCPFPYAAMALSLPRHGMYAIEGGGGALAEVLTKCIQQSGGSVRLNAPVLRLVYDADGTAVGIELLNGETVHARRAIVSNLTVWDTFGKLVGHARTPPEVRSPLKSAHSSGAYMLYLGMDEEVAARLPSDHLLVAGNSTDQPDASGEHSPLLFSATPSWDKRGPEGRRAVTVWTQTDAESWFAFHSDATEIEAQDQAHLENCWAKLHAAIPELGAGIEVIETETPHSHYERTRRRLGMVGGLAQSVDPSGSVGFGHKTPIPRLYMVGDTLYPGQGLAAVTYSALLVANELAPRS